MYKVDILMSASLKSIMGPVQTIKRILNNHDFFLNEGFEINVFTNDNFQNNLVVDKIKSKNVLIIRIIKYIIRFLSHNSKFYSKYRIDLFFKESHRLLENYQKLKSEPHIIVFHSIVDCYVYLKYFRKEGVKIALFTHSDGIMFKMLMSYYPKLQNSSVERKLMEIANYVMSNITVKPCIAKIEEKNLLLAYPQLADKTCLVINAIDDLNSSQKEEVVKIKNYSYSYKYRFVCAGSINKRKGQRTIIEALRDLSPEKLKEIHVTFIGDGAEKIPLELLVSKYKLSNNVSFKGSVKNNEVYKYLAEANIFILMSNNEGLPIALIEGMRNGLALISTNVSGIPELIEENINGKLINPNVNDLKALLNTLDQYDWKEMGINSRIIFEKEYVFTRMRSDYLNMLIKSLKNDQK